MTASAGRAARSAYISTSITIGVPIPVMAAARRIKPTLPASIPYGSLTPGSGPIYRRGNNRNQLYFTEGTFQRGHSAHAAIPHLYRSSTCSVMQVAAKEEVREQHDQRHVIRQPGLRSTESMHGRTIVRLTESLAVLSSRRRQPFEEQLAIKDSRCRAKPKSFGWSESNSPETGSRLE